MKDYINCIKNFGRFLNSDTGRVRKYYRPKFCVVRIVEASEIFNRGNFFKFIFSP